MMLTAVTDFFRCFYFSSSFKEISACFSMVSVLLGTCYTKKNTVEFNK